MKKALAYVFIIIGLVFLSGCSFFTSMTDDEIKSQTESLVIKAGSQLVIKPTVLGFGAGIKALLSDNQGVKTVTFENYLPDDSFKFSWQAKQRIETEESKEKQAEYYEQYGETAIGERVPLPPEPDYYSKDLIGLIEVSNLGQQDSLLLPELWSEGDFLTSENGIIFISNQVYNLLLSAKQAELKLGLSDSVVSKLKFYSYQAEESLNSLKTLVSDQKKTGKDSPYLLKAEDDFDQYKLKINGQTTYIEAIVSHNWFGEFIILNNPENPLVLKITPNPIAVSNDFNYKSLFGYQVTDIEL